MRITTHTSGMALIPLLLASCGDVSHPGCESERAADPAGPCVAYYYQTDFGRNGGTTQALTDCIIGERRLGGNVVAFHSIDHGIGLRWLDAHTLEVSVAKGVKLEDQRSSDVYSGYVLNYRYRELSADEPAFAGCGLALSR